AATARQLRLRCGETRGPPNEETRSQVVPPRERHTRDVESEENLERGVRAAGRFDRGAKTARKQISTAGTDGRRKSENGCALDACRLQRQGLAFGALALDLAQLLLAENDRNHPECRSVADAGRH